jgi:hypothetical protein
VDLKKVQDEVAVLKSENELLKTSNETTLGENTELKNLLTKVTQDMVTVTERVKKLEAQPLPPKGALFDASGKGIGPVTKGHEKPEAPAASDETPSTSLSYGASPEQMRAIMNLR